MKSRLSSFEIFYIGLSLWTIAAWFFPAIFAVLSMLTLGLMLLLPTLWIYTTAMLPGHILARLTGLPNMRLWVSVPIWGIAALLPNFLASYQIKSELSTVRRDDISSVLLKDNKHLIFKNVRSYYPTGKPDPLENAPCDAVCQRFLVNGVVLKITAVTTFTNENPAIMVQYNIESRPSCPKALADVNDATQELAAAALQGRCLVATIKSHLDDGVVVTSEHRENSKSFDRLLWSYRESETRSVSTRELGRETVKYRKTAFELSSIQAPFIVYLYGGLFTTVDGWKVARTERGVVMQPLEKFLQDELGLAVKPNTNDKKDQQNSTSVIPIRKKLNLSDLDVRNILLKDKALPIDPLLIGPLNEWADKTFSKRQKPNASQTALLTELIEDPRMTSLHGIAWALGQQPDLAQKNLRPILKRLSARSPRFLDNSAESLGNVLSRTENLDLTSDDQAALLSLFSSGVSENNKGLLKLLAKQPKLGVDVIRRELLNMDSNYRGLAIDAACLVERADYESLASPVRENIYSHQKRSYPPTAFRTIALQEGIEKAEEAIRYLEKPEVERLQSYGEKIMRQGKAECR